LRVLDNTFRAEAGRQQQTASQTPMTGGD
jgi:hypothetical protein